VGSSSRPSSSTIAILTYPPRSKKTIQEHHKNGRCNFCEHQANKAEDFVWFGKRYKYKDEDAVQNKTDGGN